VPIARKALRVTRAEVSDGATPGGAGAATGGSTPGGAGAATGTSLAVIVTVSDAMPIVAPPVAAERSTRKAAARDGFAALRRAAECEDHGRQSGGRIDRAEYALVTVEHRVEDAVPVEGHAITEGAQAGLTNVRHLTGGLVHLGEVVAGLVPAVQLPLGVDRDVGDAVAPDRRDSVPSPVPRSMVSRKRSPAAFAVTA
jgi:hypothetical protein